MVCRVVGWLARWVGQPQVVAEMIAGVVMGPSLLGWFLPDVQAWIFPDDSKGLLYAVSQVGLVLYMFLVGLEFDTNLIRNRLRSAAGVSLSGIVVPFALGCLLGFYLVRSGGFFAENVTKLMASPIFEWVYRRPQAVSLPLADAKALST